MFKKLLNNVELNINIDKYSVAYGESFTVTLTARGEGIVPGLKFPYRVLNGPSPFGSNIVLMDFTYDKDIDYYYLHITLSEDLGSNVLNVTQVGGPPVTLEKINATLYRYKNPLDRTEIARTFRATLEEVAADGDMVKGVRAFDFVYSNEYGYFELDDNLQSKIVFKNKISAGSEIDRVFKISLIYMPTVTASVLFLSNFLPPTPYPASPPDGKPKLKIKPSRESITEGDEALFILHYENVRKNYNIEFGYEYSTDKNSETYGKVKTTEHSTVPIRIPTTVQTDEAAIRMLNVWIKDHPKIKSSVFVNKSTGKSTLKYGPGNHTFRLGPYESYMVELVAGGGAGGGSSKVSKIGDSANTDGGRGGNTVLTVNGLSFAATGGTGGSGGKAVDAKIFIDGVNGIPLLNAVPNSVNADNLVNVLANTKGNFGSLTKTSHFGGTPLTYEGTAGSNGGGGSGAKGWFYNSSLEYRVGHGGAGASGGYLKFILTNSTSRFLQGYLTVGGGGVAVSSSSLGLVARDGSNGEGGFAIFRPL